MRCLPGSPPKSTVAWHTGGWPCTPTPRWPCWTTLPAVAYHYLAFPSPSSCPECARFTLCCTAFPSFSPRLRLSHRKLRDRRQLMSTKAHVSKKVGLTVQVDSRTTEMDGFIVRLISRGVQSPIQCAAAKLGSELERTSTRAGRWGQPPRVLRGVPNGIPAALLLCHHQCPRCELMECSKF